MRTKTKMDDEINIQGKGSSLQYINIPIEVLINTELNKTDKLLFGIIMATDRNEEHGSFWGNKKLQSLLDVSQPIISSSFSKLEKEGLIECWFDGRKRHAKCLFELGMRKIKKEKSIDNKKINRSLLKEDIKQKPKKKIKTNPLVEYWNTLENVRHHNNPASNVYKEAVRRFNQLSLGTLYKNKLNVEWNKRCKIPDRYYKRKWTEKRIKGVLDNLALMLTDGYYPQDKKWLPKNLAQLIYNPFSQKSWFMYVALNGVEQLHEKIDERKKISSGLVGELATKLKRAIKYVRGSQKLQACEYPQLITIVQKINKERQNWLSNGRGGIQLHYPSLTSQIEDYAEWIKNRHEGKKEFNAKRIGVGTFDWDDYIKHLSNSTGIKLVQD